MPASGSTAAAAWSNSPSAAGDADRTEFATGMLRADATRLRISDCTLGRRRRPDADTHQARERRASMGRPRPRRSLARGYALARPRIDVRASLAASLARWKRAMPTLARQASLPLWPGARAERQHRLRRRSCPYRRQRRAPHRHARREGYACWCGGSFPAAMRSEKPPASRARRWWKARRCRGHCSTASGAMAMPDRARRSRP